jgi:hypothetical protein
MIRGCFRWGGEVNRRGLKGAGGAGLAARGKRRNAGYRLWAMGNGEREGMGNLTVGFDIRYSSFVNGKIEGGLDSV